MNQDFYQLYILCIQFCKRDKLEYLLVLPLFNRFEKKNLLENLTKALLIVAPSLFLAHRSRKLRFFSFCRTTSGTHHHSTSIKVTGNLKNTWTKLIWKKKMLLHFPHFHANLHILRKALEKNQNYRLFSFLKLNQSVTNCDQ